MATLAPTPTETLIEQLRAAGARTFVVEHPAGQLFDTCDYSSAHDDLNDADRLAVVTLYGSETTLDVCRACALNALEAFHVDTGNDPMYTRIDVSTPAQPGRLADASWSEPVRLASVVDHNGREGHVDAYVDVFNDAGAPRLDLDVRGTYDPSTEHGREALVALRTAIDTVLGGAA